MRDIWPQDLREKLLRLQEIGDERGVLKLEFGRYVYYMRTMIPGMSQAKAAKLAGISRSQWLRMEAGRHLPRPKKIPDIADAIRVKVSGLYRKAGCEVPAEYEAYDITAAIKEFVAVLKESSDTASFLNGMQIIWQFYQQAQTGLRQRVYVDIAYAQILEAIRQRLTLPQRIKLARELVMDVSHKDVRAVLPDAQKFFDNLDRAVERLRDDRD